VHKTILQFDPMTAIQLPLSERVLDRLADILFATDEILDMIHMDEVLPDSTTQEVEASVRHVYDRVNELMKKLAD
jgi:hypothetical protein